MTKMAEELMDDTFYMLNELLSCNSPTGKSNKKEYEFYKYIEREKAEILRSDDSREYLYFAVTVMHRIADKLGDRSHYSWVAELEQKTKAALLC